MEGIFDYDKSNEEDYYKIIGCDELSSIDQILCEYKVRSLQCHPDKNIDDLNSVDKFQMLQKAKEVLTNPETRSIYDKWRKSGFAMPFDQFLNLSKASHTSIHWASKKRKEPMISHCCDTADDSQEMNPISQCEGTKCTSYTPKTKWERDVGSPLLQRFRNYEI